MPRLAGSPVLLDIEARLAERLAGWGFDVSVSPFHATAASLEAVSVFGTGIGVVGFGSFPLLVLPLAGWSVVLVIVAALAAVGVVAAGIGSDRLPSRQVPTEARNLEARREPPALWLVAHSDSKGQGLSLLGRVGAVVALAVGVLGLVVVLVYRLQGPVSWVLAALASLPLVVSGGLLSRSTPRNTSPGAVDNASGIVAVMVAAELLRDRRDVGVLITGAEEYALAGARVWAATSGTTTPFVNVDGIDARGPYHVTPHRPTGPRRAAGVEQTIAQAIRAELMRRGGSVRVAPLPPGILVDGRALAGAGQPGVSLSRGDVATLRVVHTRRDDPRRAPVDAAVEAGRAVAAAVHRVLVDGPAASP